MCVGLSNGETFGDLGRNMGKYLAKTMYHTSDFYLPTQTKRQVMAYFEGNAPMCDITEDGRSTAVWLGATFLVYLTLAQSGSQPPSNTVNGSQISLPLACLIWWRLFSMTERSSTANSFFVPRFPMASDLIVLVAEK